MKTHHQWAADKRKAYLHQEAMRRRKGAQRVAKVQAKNEAERNKSIAAGAKADAELQFGDQRNALSKLVNEAPARAATINTTYDVTGKRLEDIARGRAEAMQGLMGQVGSDMSTVQAQGAAASRGAADAMAGVGVQADPNADAASLAGQQENSAQFQAMMGGLGTAGLYDMTSASELQRNEELGAQRYRDKGIEDQLAGVMQQMGAARSKAEADRRTAYATSDAAQATADAENRKIDVSRQASVDSNNTKKMVAAMIALEKFGLLEGISAEKGSPQRVNPNILAGILNMAGVGGPDRVRGSKLRNPPPRPKGTKKPKKPKKPKK